MLTHIIALYKAFQVIVRFNYALAQVQQPFFVHKPFISFLNQPTNETSNKPSEHQQILILVHAVIFQRNVIIV